MTKNLSDLLFKLPMLLSSYRSIHFVKENNLCFGAKIKKKKKKKKKVYPSIPQFYNIKLPFLLGFKGICITRIWFLMTNQS